MIIFYHVIIFFYFRKLSFLAHISIVEILKQIHFLVQILFSHVMVYFHYTQIMWLDTYLIIWIDSSCFLIQNILYIDNQYEKKIRKINLVYLFYYECSCFYMQVEFWKKSFNSIISCYFYLYHIISYVIIVSPMKCWKIKLSYNKINNIFLLAGPIMKKSFISIISHSYIFLILRLIIYWFNYLSSSDLSIISTKLKDIISINNR